MEHVRPMVVGYAKEYERENGIAHKVDREKEDVVIVMTKAEDRGGSVYC